MLNVRPALPRSRQQYFVESREVIRHDSQRNNQSSPGRSALPGFARRFAPGLYWVSRDRSARTKIDRWRDLATVSNPTGLFVKEPASLSLGTRSRHFERAPRGAHETNGTYRTLIGLIRHIGYGGGPYEVTTSFSPSGCLAFTMGHSGEFKALLRAFRVSSFYQVLCHRIDPDRI
jgi:hypothetical protein